MPTPYHLLARNPANRWWRTLLGTVLVVVAGLAVGLATYLAGGFAAAMTGQPENADGFASFGPLVDMSFDFVMIAAFLPVTLLAAQWLQRRPAGTLSSVTGRLRWGWMLLCAPVAAGAIGTYFLVSWLVFPEGELDDGGSLAGWIPFLTSVLVLLLVVPVQAAAEEYLCRGWLLQAVGSWIRSPWVPIAVQAVIFALLHGLGTPWGFLDLVVMAVIAGWLTVRTGGLEAAIALHVVNNLSSMVIAAAYGELTVEETAADMPWQLVAIDVPVLVAYAMVVLWMARRRRLRTVVDEHRPPLPEQRRPVATEQLSPL
jgi:uncharacterized protein